MPASQILCERLKELENVLGCSPEEMAKMGECSRATYYRYRNGKSVPDLLFLNNILKNEKKVNTEWLLKGEEPILKGSRDNGYNTSSADPIRFLNLPLHKMAPSEKGGEGKLEMQQLENPSYTLPLCNTFVEDVINPDSKQLMAVIVQCDSMSPDIKPGSLIVVNTEKKDPSNDGIFMVRFDDEIRMKLIQRLPSQKLLLSTINDKFKSIQLDLGEENFEIIGRIIWRGSSV